MVQMEEKLLNKEFKLPRWNELPNVALYLDQVLSLLDSYLSGVLPGRKSVLTKTMVNNYVKQKIIPPPVNKKYEKRTVAALFLVACLKSTFAIPDIARLIAIAMNDRDMAVGYDAICDHMERCVKAAFAGGEGKSEGEAVDYLMERVADSFACQLFVMKKHLNR